MFKNVCNALNLFKRKYYYFKCLFKESTNVPNQPNEKKCNNRNIYYTFYLFIQFFKTAANFIL